MMKPKKYPDPGHLPVKPGGPGLEEIRVFVEPDCPACERVVTTVRGLERRGLTGKVVIVDRMKDPSACREYGIMVYPSTYLDGRLIFHGEFTLPEFMEIYRHLDPGMKK
jgi:predicted thioredoxin/glutaredoxin